MPRPYAKRMMVDLPHMKRWKMHINVVQNGVASVGPLTKWLYIQHKWTPGKKCKKEKDMSMIVGDPA